MALIASAAFCWGASATLGKAVFNDGFAHAPVAINPLVLAQTRTTFAFLILAPILLLLGKRCYFSIDKNTLLGALALGALGVAGSNYFYYLGIQLTSVSIAIVVQYLAPVWVLLYMLARKKQHATPPRILGVLLAVTGIALVIGLGGRVPIHYDPLGIAASLLAGVSFAIYNVGGSALLARISAISLMLYAMLGSSILWAILHPLWKLARTPFTAAQWWFLLGFAICSMLIPYLLYFLGLRHLDATSAVVTSCLEPVFAILLATTFIGEKLHALQVVGIVLVVAATMLIQRPENSTTESRSALSKA
jgi:DME family drug/metabolite transporter